MRHFGALISIAGGKKTKTGVQYRKLWTYRTCLTMATAQQDLQWNPKP